MPPESGASSTRSCRSHNCGPQPAAARAAGPEGDDVVARERALAESRDRVAALEQTRADLQRLIEARDREIAELERQVGGKAAGKSQPVRKPAP